MHQQWSSKLAFVLAAAGSAVGLGAIWKFPYMAGTGGGAAFFLIFIGFTLLIGLPLLIGEFVIGRKTQKNAVDAYRTIAPGTRWGGVGKLGIVTCFLLLSFYSVVGGWVLIYLMLGLSGQLAGLGQEGYAEMFGSTIGNPWLALSAQLIFIILAVFVVSKGIKKGIERASLIMMPALFVCFLILVIRSVTLDGAAEGLQFFLVPDFGSVTSENVLYALGQSFFALSVGVSVMVTYSSYLSKKENLMQSAFSIVALTFLVAFLAGIAIFPGVFTFGMTPDEGPALLFMVLPAVFDQMAFGMFFLVIFLVLFLFATLTSAFSMLEVIVAAHSKDDVEKRPKSTWMFGLLIFLVGIPSALSFGVGGEFIIFGNTVFDNMDFLVSNILMPLGAFLIAVFVPMKMGKEELFAELRQEEHLGRKLFTGWYIFIRYVAPVVILLVFLDVAGVFTFIFDVALGR